MLKTKLINGKLSTFLEAVPYKDGDVLCNGDEKIIKQGRYFIDEFGIRKARWDFIPTKKEKLIITATPNLKLEGVYEISLEEDVEKKAKESYYSNGKVYKPKSGNEFAYIEGYKAASQDKKYTEEDMLRLAIYCWNIASRPIAGKTYNINEIVNEEIKRLSLIRGVWVEVEAAERFEEDEVNYQFKVSDNQLTVIQIIK